MNYQRTASRATLKIAIVAFVLMVAMALCVVQANAATSLNVRQSTSGNKTTQVVAIWNNYTGAAYYEVEVYTYNDNGKKISVVAPTTWTDNAIRIKKLATNRNYTISVKAYDESGNYLAYESEELKPVPTKETGLVLDTYYPSINQADFAWNKRAAADGYQFQVFSTSGNTKYVDKKIGNRYSAYTSVKGKLKINRFYKARVRAYIKVNGKKIYGKYSNYRYFSGGPKNVSLKKYSSKMRIKWDKVTGATGYNVYVSTSKPSNLSDMKKFKSTKSTSCNLTKFKGKKYKKSRTYYVYVVAKKKVGSNTFKSVPYYYRYI